MHPAKTEVPRRGSRQEVTKLVVNEAREGVAEARVPVDMTAPTKGRAYLDHIAALEAREA